MFRKFGLFVLVFTSYFAVAATGLAAPGDLDPIFGDQGVVNTQFVVSGFDRSISAYDVVVLADGKILAVGNMYDFGTAIALVRYNADGSLDPYFGNNGKVLSFLNIQATALRAAVQPDGRIIVAGRADANPPGHAEYFVARYTDYGTLDQTFGSGGVTHVAAGNGSLSIVDVRFQPDGKMVFLGHVQYEDTFDLARLNVNGSLDTSFGSGGEVSVNIGEGYPTQLSLQRDGKMVVVGSLAAFSFTARYNRDGTLDKTFGGTGIVQPHTGLYTDYMSSVTVQPDNRIVTLGLSFDEEKGLCYQAAVRYLPDGGLDDSFGGGGIARSTAAYCTLFVSAAVQTNGKIVGVGGGLAASLIRYNPDGSRDESFGDSGNVMLDLGYSSILGPVAIQPDGKIISAGGRALTYYSSTNIIVVRLLGDAVAPTVKPFDFDGDGRSDIAVFRPGEGTWYVNRSSLGSYGAQFGLPTDRIVPADFDGDGKTDIAVYRPSSGTWYWVDSSDSSVHGLQFGTSEDLPTPADYDGDGRADISVFRPSAGTWYRENSSDGSFFARQFGASQDKPVAGDYDGDRRADLAVFRPSSGTWYWLNSSGNSASGEQFGSSGDMPVPADYDGDGKTDLAVWRPSSGHWYTRSSYGLGYAQYRFGLPGDIPVPADFDGDGHADKAVFRPSEGNWYRVNSSNEVFSAYRFGVTGDIPAPAAFAY
jgi:uncharacterized delta-60 repeat protein